MRFSHHHFHPSVYQTGDMWMKTRSYGSVMISFQKSKTCRIFPVPRSLPSEWTAKSGCIAGVRRFSRQITCTSYPRLTNARAQRMPKASCSWSFWVIKRSVEGKPSGFPSTNHPFPKLCPPRTGSTRPTRSDGFLLSFIQTEGILGSQHIPLLTLCARSDRELCVLRGQGFPGVD